MSPAPDGCPDPMDQGDLGTCVGYAFAQVLSQSLLVKYGIAVPKQDLVSKVKALCPCWNGSSIRKVCFEWNQCCSVEGGRVEELHGRALHKVFVSYVEFPTAAAAWQKLKAVHGNALLMASVKTSANGHAQHAVALCQYYPEPPNMQAVNSWGPQEPLMHVGDKNFLHAVYVEAHIQYSWKKRNTSLDQVAAPAVNDFFTCLRVHAPLGLVEWQVIPGCDCPGIVNLATSDTGDIESIKEACEGRLRDKGIEASVFVVGDQGQAHFKTASLQQILAATIVAPNCFIICHPELLQPKIAQPLTGFPRLPRHRQDCQALRDRTCKYMALSVRSSR